MVVAKFLVFIFPFFLLSSCFLWEKTPEIVKQEFSYQDQKEASISGVYAPDGDSTNSIYFIFYEDNTFVNVWSEVWDALKDGYDEENEVFYFYRRNGWGYYTLNNDSTVFILNIQNRGYRNLYWWVSEGRYLQRDLHLSLYEARSIYPLPDKNRNPADSSGNIRKFNPSEHNLIFIDSCDCKKSDSWQKYESWFWKNEQDYTDWIEKSGGDKDKYHRHKPSQKKPKKLKS